LIEKGWGASNPSYRHFCTSGFIPDAATDQANSLDELQRVSANKENAARIHVMNGAVDVSELAKKLNKPCLVLHCEGDRVSPLEKGRRKDGSFDSRGSFCSPERK
tara:strand:+ start:842 stop:1156 length:315 start_codon:yes stop_codon:yes gene_type:complete